MTKVHIYAPPVYYIGQVRGYGCRNWQTVTRAKPSASKALAQAVLAMDANDKRARVLMVCKDGWHESTVVMEASR